MSRPLPPGDLVEVGPFRLSARLGESPAGIVYLGVDGSGRQVSVAVLNRGAAGDAAARDRFRAAIASAWRSGAPVGGSAEASPEVSPVVAAQPEGGAPWVATLYEPDRVGAGRFLEPVVLEGTFRGRWGGRRRGPQFQPHWSGSGEPAVAVAEPVAVAPGGAVRQERGLVAAILTLAAVLLVLALLMLVLFACQPKVEQPPPAPPEPTPTMPSPTSSTPSPTGPPSTTPTPGPTTGDPGDDGGGDDGAPL